jgi:hypothetical protein
MNTSKINAFKKLVLTGLIGGITLSTSPNLFADNPIVSHIYTADPSAHVFNDTLYVYPSHDQDDSNWYNMVDYHVLSTVDGDTWTDHGVALHIDDVPWASEYMWAPDCAYKDGTYYFYFPARDLDGDFRIGVATSDSPAGPFIPEDEPIAGSFSMDPAVFVDDDGQAYMIFGGQGHGQTDTAWGVKLDSTMKAFDGEPQAIEGLTYWFEGSWLHKRNGLYYMSYSAGSNYPTGSSSPILYATATSPLGPYTYQGLIGEATSGWTDHNSIVEYNNQWYFFHQSSELSGGISSRRCVEAEYLHYNDDGTIRKIVRTERGIGSYDGLAVIEAENYSHMDGLVKEECSDGGFDMGSMDDGDWIEFKNVEFGSAFVGSFTANVASANDGGVIEVRVGSLEGELIGSCEVGHTGGWQEWVDVSTNITLQSGTQDIYLTFVGAGTDLFNLNRFSFEAEAELRLDSDEIAFDLMAPATLATGRVEIAYVADTNVDVAVSLSEESHPGAFTLLNSTPMTLTEPSPSTTELEFVFDNSSIGLTDGESATGLVTVVWNMSGNADTIEIVLPISVEYVAQDTGPILWDIGRATDGANIPSTVADFVAAGVSEDLSGATVSNVEGAQNMVSGDITVDLSTYRGTYLPSGTYAGAGASLMKEYLWHTGSSEIVIGGLSRRLTPNTEYNVYVWGKGDGLDQTATFSFEGTSSTTATNDVFTSDATNFLAKFSFTTDLTVADTLSIGWDRNSEYTALNAFAIVAIDPTIEMPIDELGTSPAAVNPLDLTTEGTTDWVMLGRSGSTANRDEKAGADYIGEVIVVGTHDTYAANAYLSRWTDGSPTATASDIQGCWEVKPPAIDDIQALQFSVAGLTPGAYTMKLYCSRYKATGRLTASNDTESYSADFDEGGAGVDSVYGVFTVNFPITFTGESLDVSLDVTALGHSVYGNVAISAITLVQTSIDDWIVDDISIELGTGGTEISFSFGTEAGATYGIQSTDDLTDPTSWTNLITGILGDGDIVTVTKPIITGSEFYRIYIEK